MRVWNYQLKCQILHYKSETNLLCIVSFSAVDSNAFMNVPEIWKSFFVSRGHCRWDIFQHNFLVFGGLHVHLKQKPLTIRKCSTIYYKRRGRRLSCHLRKNLKWTQHSISFVGLQVMVQFDSWKSFGQNVCRHVARSETLGEQVVHASLRFTS